MPRFAVSSNPSASFSRIRNAVTTIYDLKPRFQALLRPIVRRLAARGVTANQITLSALILSCAAGFFIAFLPGWRWTFLLIPLTLFVRMALNAIDGMLAREHGMQTSLGTFLNELGDVLSDIVLYLPFALIPGINAILVVIFVVLAVISEMTGVVAVQIGAQRRYNGPMGKSDRACLFGLVGLLLGFGLEIHLWINIALSLAWVLLLLTIKNRVQSALMEVS
jgi:CDP-diacylglycerol--glycerol-3-phosphate 3-phosphatidyltransferase